LPQKEATFFQIVNFLWRVKKVSGKKNEILFQVFKPEGCQIKMAETAADDFVAGL
jgi:hypothetical protein